MMQTMWKMKNKKGFTLVEMLIVVAIIAILVVIAIPIFNAQLEKAKKAVDTANVRTATSLAVAQYYLDGGVTKEGGKVLTYNFDMTKDSELKIITANDAGTVLPPTETDGYNQAEIEAATDPKQDKIEAEKGYIQVTVNDGNATAKWIEK